MHIVMKEQSEQVSNKNGQNKVDVEQPANWQTSDQEVTDGTASYGCNKGNDEYSEYIKALLHGCHRTREGKRNNTKYFNKDY